MSNALFKLFWDFCNIWNSHISNETCCQVTDTDYFDVIPQAIWIQNMSLETFAWTLYVIQSTWVTSTHYNDMGSLSASSGQRTPNCVTSNSNLIFSICNFVHKQRQLWFFSPNSNSNDKHNHVSKFSRLHRPGQQTQNCVTSAAAVALLNDSAASASTAAATTYCSSNPHKSTQNIHMLLLKFSKISMLLQFVQIHTNSNLLKTFSSTQSAEESNLQSTITLCTAVVL